MTWHTFAAVVGVAGVVLIVVYIALVIVVAYRMRRRDGETE